MELSVREARAQFSKAIEAAQRGERVVITKHGVPVAELGPAEKRAEGDFWARIDAARELAGLKVVDFDPWPEELDDPALSRAVLKLDENPGIEPR